MRQPCPARSAPPMIQSMRNEHVAPARRAVGEGRAAGQMPPADLDARMVGRDQRERDADILAAAEMVVGIEQAEGEAEQRRLGRERDVALVPGEPDAERLLALMLVRA